jgi:O-acetyl-ADP-ribose deacetylase
MKRIELKQGDITKLEVDAIVNAANNSLLGGGGVDGAIHRAAGKGLLEECKKIGGCPTGEARLTSGYDLPAKYVIHTVGPVWKNGIKGEEKYLANCYRNSLQMALDNNIKSIAFPNISTGVYGFPKEFAASIALREVSSFLSKTKKIKKVIFVAFDEENYNIYKNKLGELK